MTEWISVKDELPSIDIDQDDVITWDGYEIDMASPRYFLDHIHEFTHWMRLPKLPE